METMMLSRKNELIVSWSHLRDIDAEYEILEEWRNKLPSDYITLLPLDLLFWLNYKDLIELPSEFTERAKNTATEMGIKEIEYVDKVLFGPSEQRYFTFSTADDFFKMSNKGNKFPGYYTDALNEYARVIGERKTYHPYFPCETTLRQSLNSIVVSPKKDHIQESVTQYAVLLLRDIVGTISPGKEQSTLDSLVLSDKVKSFGLNGVFLLQYITVAEREILKELRRTTSCAII
jgi:hypothetical protein